MQYANLIVSTAGPVLLVRFNRPSCRNALNSALMNELQQVLRSFESDVDLGCLVLTGKSDVFSSGADIKEMMVKGFPDAFLEDYITRNWEEVTRCRKPIIAAVSGLALGGGCELAMMCDLIIAADNAVFGQPEIFLGVSPGAGGSQRLTRIVGKSKAMEMCLTGRNMSAHEAEQAGLVSRVVSLANLEKEALNTAQLICRMSRPAIMATKECVNRAYETSLAEGVRFERRIFHSLFATEDHQEGMLAFAEKRKPNFRNL